MIKQITTQDLLKKRVGVISLGCDKNRVDTEYILYLLKEYGFNITNSVENAEIILVNTCAFLESARKEAYETVFECAKLKNNGVCEKLLMLGCVPNRFGEELKADLPEVDAVVQVKDYANIVNIIRKIYGLNEATIVSPNYVCKRIISTKRHYAYLKIADGCNNNCSYCLIPSIRGNYKSRPMEEIINEARELVKYGVRELILIAQDTTRYGVDLYKKPCLVELVKRLSLIKDLKWIRIHYCYPELVTDELIEEVSKNPKVCKYLDIPLQHVDSDILKAMNRRTNSLSTKALIGKIHTIDPNISIRTSIIVGFPGETKEQFNNLMEFLKQYKINNVGCFEYSRENGTKSYDMPNQVSKRIKGKRFSKVMEQQYKIVKELNKRYIGNIQEVVVDDYNTNIGYYICRNEYNSPDVDTIVYVSTDKKLKIGDFIKVKITQVLDYDLKGELIVE